MTTYLVMMCDHPGCNASAQKLFPMPNVRSDLSAEGWMQDAGYAPIHYCKEHAAQHAVQPLGNITETPAEIDARSRIEYQAHEYRRIRKGG